MNIFELLNEKYILPNKPKLLENFSGIGCQLMAFNRLGIEVESVGVSEIDKDAILSYAAIHNNLEQYMIEQHDYPTKKQMVDQLQKMNVGYDFKKHRHTITMSMNEDKVKRYYAANLLSKNRGDISKVKGFDLGEVDVFTYSFPCTDLSKAGKQKGLDGTRSGLVYEVLRIMQECKVNGNLPKVLIMENVVDLVQSKFIRQFQEIQLELEQLGFSNYTQTLNAKDYGVAQNRDRVFMVSILGDYYYEFPKSIKLEKRLKDYLESEVDPKYYLSDIQIESMKNAKFESMGLDRVNADDDVCNTITTMSGGNREPKVSIVGNVNPSGNGMNGNVFSGELSPTLTTNKGEGIKIIEILKLNENRHSSLQNSVVSTNGLCPTIDAMGGGNREPKIGYAVTSREFKNNGCQDMSPTLCARDYKDPKCVLIPEDTKQGYAKAYDGDGVYTNRPHQKRGVVQQCLIQTLKTSCSDVGVVVYDDYNQQIRSDQDTIGTLTTNCGSSTERNGYKLIENNLRIRKLTPKECFRLMGIDDEDFTKASQVCSNSQLYKQAGNGIVVDVFAAVLSTMQGEQNE